MSQSLEFITHPSINQYCLENSQTQSALSYELVEYTRKNVPNSQMLIGPLEASFLQLLIHANKAKRILEVGCYTGYSALVMAEALPKDGEVITLDINEETSKIARAFWSRSPHGSKIKLMVAPAIESLKKITGEFDLAFIDADKTGYPHYFEAILPKIKKSGLIVSDNCLQDGKVLGPTAADTSARAIQEYNRMLHQRSDLHISLLPIRDGISVVVKL